MSAWEVFAVKYADRNSRTRADSFLFDERHDAPHSMDYFVWLLRRGTKVILVDTGYDQQEADNRARPIRMDPRAALAPFDISPKQIDHVIVTHLHYDHAGGLHLFPNAHLHLQAAEMAFATGPCMCHEATKFPFSANHVCEAVQRLYAGKLTFYDGGAEISDGVTVHCIGGHSKGLQVVRVRTEAGWMVLASDASHYYENFMRRKVFPLVVDVPAMLDGFLRLEELASRPELIIPGHDPLVTSIFPDFMAPHIWRLDRGPINPLPGFTQ